MGADIEDPPFCFRSCSFSLGDNDMDTVLKSLKLEGLTKKFQTEHIVCKLSVHEMEMLGINSRSDMMSLRWEEFTLMVALWVIRARLREIQRFVLEFKANSFFLNSYNSICHVLPEKSNLWVQGNSTLNLECKELRDQFLENFHFSIYFL